MTILRHTQYRRHQGPPRIPHYEQLALHAAVLAIAVTAVLLTLLG